MMYLFCFCYFLLNTSKNVQMDRIDGSLCISAKKNSGLHTIKLAFGINLFSLEQTGTLRCSPVLLWYCFHIFIFHLFTHSI